MQQTSKAAAAYKVYEELGPDRSLTKVAQFLYGEEGKRRGKTVQLERWSVQYGWVARARAYDAEKMRRERMEQERRERERERKRAARQLQREEDRERMEDERAPIMQAEWKKTLVQINQRLDAGETKGLVGLVALLKHAMDEERICRGGVTTINEQRVTGKDGESLMTPVGQAIAAALMARMGSNPQARDVIATALLEEASDETDLLPG